VGYALLVLTKTTSFTFRFQKTENIVFTNRTLDVTNDGTVGIVHEFNTNLSNTTTRTGTAENLCNSSKLNRSLCVLSNDCQYKTELLRDEI
jgi:hypothetical protein